MVKSVRLIDNGDNDGFADPNETVSVYVTLRNGTFAPARTGIVVTVASTDPTIACIPTPTLAFGSLAAGETRESATALVLRVADVVRTDPLASLTATLDFQISGDDFGGLSRPQQLALDVDLNVSGGLIPGSYTEGFESGGFGTFTTQTLDAGRESLADSDGYRCQYNDPDNPNSRTYGSTYCFLGAATPSQNAYDWHVHTMASPDGGRAYLGNNSLHWGVHPSAVNAGSDTTRLRQLDAIRTTLPINLGWNGTTSELSFKHQVGLTDSDYVSGFGSLDRGVVQIQLASSTGSPVGIWRKAYPYENLYDTVGMDNYLNCMFDPTDDGDTEDDFFQPTDPERRMGPSSTCGPEFAFSRLGAIFFSDIFDAQDIGHASDGPGLQGSLGPGTWVESKVDLSRYRGRRIRLRFLTTTVEIGNTVLMEDALEWNPIEADDGWYIDDVRVTNTLLSQATVAVDAADRSGLPACGPVCGSVTASLVATPNTVGPDEAVTLDASGSAADQCPGGALHYRFWLDADANGLLDFYSGPLFSPPDQVLQEWSPSAIVTSTRNATSLYAVEVRCSTRPACADVAFVEVPFVCPSKTFLPFPASIGFTSHTALAWDASESIRTHIIRGDLNALRAGGGQFNGSVLACVVFGTFEETVSDPIPPLPGQGFYYLARELGALPVCSFHSWSTFSPAEVPGNRDAGIPLDPDTCPAAN